MTGKPKKEHTALGPLNADQTNQRPPLPQRNLSATTIKPQADENKAYLDAMCQDCGKQMDNGSTNAYTMRRLNSGSMNNGNGLPPISKPKANAVTNFSGSNTTRKICCECENH